MWKFTERMACAGFVLGSLVFNRLCDDSPHIVLNCFFTESTLGLLSLHSKRFRDSIRLVKKQNTDKHSSETLTSQATVSCIQGWRYNHYTTGIPTSGLNGIAFTYYITKITASTAQHESEFNFIHINWNYEHSNLNATWNKQQRMFALSKSVIHSYRITLMLILCNQTLRRWWVSDPVILVMY